MRKQSHLCQRIPEVSANSRTSFESQAEIVIYKNGNFSTVDICWSSELASILGSTKEVDWKD